MPDDTLQVRGDKIYFAEPLAMGIVVRRPNRFIIDVEVDGAVMGCHSPTTGRIGNLVLDGLPCLLSRSHSATRKTPYTVEAISVDLPGSAEIAWIGINQNAANRYVEHALRHRLLPGIVTTETLLRERCSGSRDWTFS